MPKNLRAGAGKRAAKRPLTRKEHKIVADHLELEKVNDFEIGMKFWRQRASGLNDTCLRLQDEAKLLRESVEERNRTIEGLRAELAQRDADDKAAKPVREGGGE